VRDKARYKIPIKYPLEFNSSSSHLSNSPKAIPVLVEIHHHADFRHDVPVSKGKDSGVCPWKFAGEGIIDVVLSKRDYGSHNKALSKERALNIE
jgi:hypothetical protein